MKKILFITSNRIGDAVLSTGILNALHLAQPEAKFTIVCGALPAPLFEGFPALDRVIILNKKKHHAHWWDLWREVVQTRWDMVVDLRDSIVSRTIWAPVRRIYGAHIPKTLHKAAQAAALIGLFDDQVPFPTLWPSKTQHDKAQQILSSDLKTGQKHIAIAPTANWLGKTWPPENFMALLKQLKQKHDLFKDAKLIVFAAPNERDQANPVIEGLKDDYHIIDCIGNLNTGEAAAVIAGCDFFIGNDSGLMHIAAASNIPTFGLFGPSWPHLYAPFGQKTAWVQTPKNFDELIDFPDYDPKTCGCLMDGLSVDHVLQALDKFL